MKTSEENNQSVKTKNYCSFVIFTAGDGHLLSAELFDDPEIAGKTYDREVREEFDRIRKEFPKARHFRESISAFEASMSWKHSVRSYVTEFGLSGMRELLALLFNIGRIRNNSIHVELGETLIG